jgi:cytochrome c-type biogenesis protein
MSELGTAFLLGLLNISNPCVLPLYPGFLAYLACAEPLKGRAWDVRWLGLVALLGVLASMLAFGLALAVLQVAVGRALSLLLPVLYLLVIGMGILLIAGRNPFRRSLVLEAPRAAVPPARAFLYGVFYGPMTLPCTGPLVVGAFAYGGGDARTVLDGVAYALAFGLGFGLPLAALPLLAAPARKRALGWLTAHHGAVLRVAGLVLVGIGLFGFATEWELLRSYLGG